VVVVEGSKMSSPCVNIDEAGRDDAAVGGGGTGSRSELVMVMAGGVDYDG
jgi:hypothetical protein